MINVSRTEENRKLSNLPWAEGLRASLCSEPTSHHPPVAAAAAAEAEAEAAVAAAKINNKKQKNSISSTRIRSSERESCDFMDQN